MSGMSRYRDVNAGTMIGVRPWTQVQVTDHGHMVITNTVAAAVVKGLSLAVCHRNFVYTLGFHFTYQLFRSYSRIGQSPKENCCGRPFYWPDAIAVVH